MDSRGFVFSTDVLLALVIVTVAIGIASAQYESLNYQIQDFTGRQSLEAVATDAADYLVKSSGDPTYWETSPSSSTLPGLASTTTFGSNPNFLNPKKISTLYNNPGYLYNLLHTSNYELSLVKVDTSTSTSSWPTLIDVMSPNSTLSIGNANEVAVVNRTVVVLSYQTQFSMENLTHINPANPGKNKGNLWYLKSAQSYFVGPGNVTTATDGNSSFNVSYEDLEAYDYYIIVDENDGVNTIFYGFTDGDAVVNGSYGDFNDKNRKTAVDDALKYVYGKDGWQKLSSVQIGDWQSNKVNDELKAVLDKGGGPDMKVWVNVESDPKDTLSFSVLQVHKDQAPFQRIPAKLVLKVWE